MPTDPPVELTTEEQNELDRLKELKRQRELHEAFEAVFGVSGRRTVHQVKVLEFLGKYVGSAREALKLDASGAVDSYRCLASLGQRAMLAEIWHRINWTEGGTQHVDPSE